MSNIFKKSVIGSAIALGLLAGAPAMADVSANVGATSNYIWRGITQNNDQAAISGGLDYSNANGIYAGTWISDEGWTNANSTAKGSHSSYETDYYAGYKGTAGAVDYDIGYIEYTYPGTKPSVDFGEVHVGGSFKMLSAKVSYDGDNKNLYTEAAVNFPLPADYGLGVHVGHYNYDSKYKTANGVVDYTDYALTISKGDFSLAVSNTTENVKMLQSDTARVAVTYTKSF